MTDLKHAFRMLGKNPGFTAVAIITLALGIGATTAIYSVVNDVILDPVPGANAGELVIVQEHDTRQNWELGLSEVQLGELRERTNVFQDIAAMSPAFGEQLDGDFVERIRGYHVTPNFFEILRVQPQLGRLFASDLQFNGDESVMVLNHRWWRQQFGGDTNVIGRTVQMNGLPFDAMTIIGVAPPSFQFPNQSEFCHFWIPTKTESYRGPGNPRRHRNWGAVARLAPGVSHEQAQATLSTMSARLAEQFPDSNAHIIIQIKPLQALFSTWEIRQIYLGLLAAIVIVLLISSANVANLLLAKSENRRQEMAVRLAMGASPVRLIRQTLIECVLLSLIAGTVGLLFTHWGIELLKTFLYGTIPLLREIQLDTGVFVAALALSIATGVGFGLAPAWQASRAQIHDALKSVQRGVVGARNRWLTKSLVVAEIALALVLLIGAGLMVKSMSRVLAVDPGFDHRQLLRVGFETGRVRVPWSELYNTQRSVMERFKALPTVDAVGLVTPTTGTQYEVEGHDEPTFLINRYCSVGEHDYFQAMKAPLIAGRAFTSDDGRRGRRGIIVNQALAKQFWPDQNPIGKRIRHAGPDAGRWMEVVGVVGDIRETGFDHPAAPLIYEPATRRSASYAAIYVRSSGRLDALAPAIRAEVGDLATGFAALKIDIVEDILHASSKPRRVCMTIFLTFAALGLVLAVMGIYSVTAYAAARRTHEIGVRVALGANKAHVFRLILSQGFGLIAAGIFLGWGAAYGLTRLLTSLLYEVKPTDPKVFATLAMVLAVVAFAGCVLPARRATNINPTEALRHE